MSATRSKSTTPTEREAPWKHGIVPVIGLVGAIGGGKSLVAAMLSARGALVIDADSMGHRLLENPSIRNRLVDRFGSRILHAIDTVPCKSEPSIDRKALARIVFADLSALRELESLLHPLIRNEFNRIIEQTSRDESAPAIVLDAALLLEAGWHDLCDYLVCVDSPHSVRLERVRAQRGWSAETLAAREQAQWPLDRKKRHSDFVIMNDAGTEKLQIEVDRLWSMLSRYSPTAQANRKLVQEA